MIKCMRNVLLWMMGWVGVVSVGLSGVPPVPGERLYLHLAEEVWVSGQPVWFRAYLHTDSAAQPASQVIYVSLRNAQEQVVSLNLKVAQGTAQGNFMLPDTLSSGWYQLTAYTQWMRNFPADHYFQQNIFVFNPLEATEVEKIAGQQVASVAAKIVQSSQPSELGVSLRLPKQTFAPREKVELQLRLPVEQDAASPVRASVSVRKVNPLMAGVVSPTGQTSRQPAPQSLRYAKETEGMVLSGTVTDRQGHPLADSYVLFSIPGTSPRFDYNQTDARGRFYFPIENIYGTQEMILQVPGNVKGYRIVLDEKFAPPAGSQRAPAPALPPDKLKPWAEASRKRTEIRQLYSLYNEDTIAETGRKKDSFKFYGAANFTRQLDEYISLPTFVEVCRELLPGIRLRAEDKGHDLDVFDIRTRRFLEGEPTLLIDGVPVYDVDKLVAMPPDTIDRIETVNRRTYYGEYALDGTVAVYTKSGQEYLNFLPDEVLRQDYTFLALSQSFAAVYPQAQQPASPRTPDFRTLLYWEPNVKVDEQGQAALEFYNADETGTFEVVLQGMTTGGRMFSHSVTYEVAYAFH